MSGFLGPMKTVMDDEPDLMEEKLICKEPLPEPIPDPFRLGLLPVTELYAEHHLIGDVHRRLYGRQRTYPRLAGFAHRAPRTRADRSRVASRTRRG